MAKMRAVAYYRVSGRSQIDGDGFPRQQAAVRSFAQKHDIEIVQEFRDEGISGTVGVEGRPGMTQMFARIAQGDIRLVLIERSDRLARELLEHELILMNLRHNGIGVIDCESGEDLTVTDSPSKVLIRQIFGAVAQYDKACLVAKLAAARERMRRAGKRCEGRRPFGFNPGEISILNRIATLRQSGATYAQIAEVVNQEGLPTFSRLRGIKGRENDKWTAYAVRNLIRRLERERQKEALRVIDDSRLPPEAREGVF